MESLPAFQTFRSNGMDVTISFMKAPSMDDTLQEKIMDLMRKNMQLKKE